MSININEVQPLHLFSEVQHYVAVDVQKDVIKVKRLGTDEIIDLSPKYVELFLKTADQYDTEVKVGKEDKYWTQKQIDNAIDNDDFTKTDAPQVGDVRVKGIRTIWEEIHSTQVFSVCYLKQDKAKSAKQLKSERDAQSTALIAEIEKAAISKKGVAKVASEAIKKVQENPILDYIPGEERVLRGYKLQFHSRDGKYDCLDVDIIPEQDGSMKGVRPVNINSILWLVFDGVKYTVE